MFDRVIGESRLLAILGISVSGGRVAAVTGLAKIVTVVVLIDFLEAVIETGPDIVLLYHGAAIALVITAIALATKVDGIGKES